MSIKSIVYPLSMGVDSETIGNLADLTTTNKTNVVSAVNEINGKFPVSIANGGTGASTAEGALVNLNLIDTTEQDFAGNSEADYITAVRNYFEANSEEYIPFVFNAGWQGQGYGMAVGVKTLDLGDHGGQTSSIMIFNQQSGVKFYIRDPNSQWRDYSPNGIVLYENSSGTQNTITLSDDAQHYKYFEIYYKNDAGVFSYTKVEAPNDKIVELSMLGYYDNQMYLRTTNIVISGTSITWRNGSYGWGTTSNNGTHIYDGNSLLYITKVIGYR